MKINKSFKALLALMFPILVLSSCDTTKNIVYAQDFGAGSSQTLAGHQKVKVQIGDKIDVQVYCDNAELAGSFNLTKASNDASSTGGGDDATKAYTINSNGDIKMPGLGVIPVAGKTREEISEYIENELTKRNLLQNPVVTVGFKEFFVTVVGDVASPHRVDFTKDEMTLTEAIAECGDLQITGVRNTVKVIRKEGETKKAYMVDLRNAKSLYQSPVYYLQPNDVIYVEPNKIKANQSSLNANTLRTPSFWMSLCSFVMTVAILVAK